MRQESVIGVIATAQGGVIGVDQLHSLGLDDCAIRRRVEAGWLHPWLRGVYAVGHTRIGALGRRMAAVLACGDGTVISHQTAADAWDLLANASPTIHVSVPTPGGRKGHQSVRIHRRPHLPAASKTRLGPLPITTPEQTLLDIAVETSAIKLRKAIDRADDRRLLDHTTLTSLATSGQRGAQKLRAALDRPSAPTRSELEDAMVDLCDTHGIPRPLVNQPVGPYIADFLWPDDHLVVETDGYEHHRGRDPFRNDRRRDAELLTTYGLVTVRFTYEDVIDDAPLTAQRIQAARRRARGPGSAGRTSTRSRRRDARR